MLKVKEWVIWSAIGVLVIAWVIAYSAHFGPAGFFPNMPSRLLGGGYNVSDVWLYSGAVVLAFLVLATVSVYNGLQTAQQQAALERRYRHAVEEAYRGILHALTSALDLRDDETYGHSRRVMGYSLAIGRHVQLSQRELQVLARGALLHDLGKIGIRDEILLKPAGLDKGEIATMRQHVVIGHQLVHGIPFLAEASAVVRHHHERFDGQGYPDRLIGDDIPLLARVFAVADAFDAMTSMRPYRMTPFTLAEARQVIEAEAGRQFCPWVVQAFLAVPVDELQQIRNESFLPLTDLGDLIHLDSEFVDTTPHDFRDALTGTYSRSAWEAKMARLGRLLGVALGTVVTIDMNNLQQVNTALGHLTGDRALVDLGARLLQLTPEVYRLGSDEFVLWFPPDGWDDNTHQRLTMALGHFANDWAHLHPEVSARWSVASAGVETRSIADLLAVADRTESAVGGKNRATG